MSQLLLRELKKSHCYFQKYFKIMSQLLLRGLKKLSLLLPKILQNDITVTVKRTTKSMSQLLP
jgi:hypothetical protein